jgi:uncharacterized membrane protein
MPQKQLYDLPDRSEDYMLKLRDSDNESLALKATTILILIIVSFAFIYAIVNQIGEPLYNFLGLVVTPILTAFSYQTGLASGKKQGAMEEKLKSQTQIK